MPSTPFIEIKLEEFDNVIWALEKMRHIFGPTALDQMETLMERARHIGGDVIMRSVHFRGELAGSFDTEVTAGTDEVVGTLYNRSQHQEAIRYGVTRPSWMPQGELEDWCATKLGTTDPAVMGAIRYHHWGGTNKHPAEVTWGQGLIGETPAGERRFAFEEEIAETLREEYKDFGQKVADSILAWWASGGK